MPVPPVWRRAVRPILSKGVVFTAAHRQVAPDADGDVVVLLGLEARTGALRFEGRAKSEGMPVRTGQVEELVDRTVALGVYSSSGSLAFSRFDGAGRLRGQVRIPPRCPIDGREHTITVPLHNALLMEPISALEDGVVFSWELIPENGEVVRCLECRDAFDGPPRWAAADSPVLAGEHEIWVLILREEQRFLAARDVETGRILCEIPEGDLRLLGWRPGVVYALDLGPRSQEIEDRLADDPEMATGHPLIHSPVRYVALDAATGTERWALEIEGDVGSAWEDGEDTLLASAREDGSGALHRIGPDGVERVRLAIPSPSEAPRGGARRFGGGPSFIGFHKGAVIWQGPRGIGATRLDGACEDVWRLDDPDLAVEALVARTDAPLDVELPAVALDDGILVLRTVDDRLLGFELP